MISYIKGTLAYVSENAVIVEAGGIGYKIFVSASFSSLLPTIGQELKIYTYMSVKEDSVALFGFGTVEELDLFHLLITVSGVGPKGALAFLSCLKPSEIIMAILCEDVATLSKAPGVGKKTAQRIILELKDKFKTTDFIEEKEAQALQGAIVPSSNRAEAVEALLTLGYSRVEALKAVSSCYQEGMTAGTLLKLALKEFVKE